MQQLEISHTASRATGSRPLQAWLRRQLTPRRGLVLGGIAVVAAGLTLGWNWLSAVGIAPIILALAPCAIMCTVGACAVMKCASLGTKPDASQGPPARKDEA